MTQRVPRESESRNAHVGHAMAQRNVSTSVDGCTARYKMGSKRTEGFMREQRLEAVSGGMGAAAFVLGIRDTAYLTVLFVLIQKFTQSFTIFQNFH